MRTAFFIFQENLYSFTEKNSSATDGDFSPYFCKRCIFVFHERSDANKAEGVRQRIAGGIGAANTAPMPKNKPL